MGNGIIVMKIMISMIIIIMSCEGRDYSTHPMLPAGAWPYFNVHNSVTIIKYNSNDTDILKGLKIAPARYTLEQLLTCRSAPAPDDTD